MFNWQEIGMVVLEAVLPLLAVTVTGWVLGLAARIWQEYVANKPDVMRVIDTAAFWIVPIVEQLKKTGAIPDNAAAKEYAINAVLEYLAEAGLAVDGERIRRIISDSIEGAVDRFNQFRPSLGVE